MTVKLSQNEIKTIASEVTDKKLADFFQKLYNMLILIDKTFDETANKANKTK